jgi:response regulator RpfG family c-di-GMP phosphodiesterase
MINVLYVDDEQNNLQSFHASLRRFFTIHTALSAKEAEVILSENDIHVLITDQRMPLTSGTELLTETAKKYPEQIRILLTAHADVQCLEDAINLGKVHAYLQKPWNDDKLKEVIEEGYVVYTLRKKEQELTLQLQRTIEELELRLKKSKPST